MSIKELKEPVKIEKRQLEVLKENLYKFRNAIRDLAGTEPLSDALQKAFDQKKDKPLGR